MSDADDLGAQGGDLRSLGYGDWLDLSTCVNGYGPAPAAVDALRMTDPQSLIKHPYEEEHRLRAAYAAHLGVDGTDLVIGRGTTEFIWSLWRVAQGRSVAVPLPAYTDFLRAFGRETLVSEGTGKVTLDLVENCFRRSDIVLISNPSNPTGTLLPPCELEAICQAHPTTTLVVDESYVEFLQDPSTGTLIGSNLPNVVVLRSPSKFYGIAGVRTGIAWSRDAELRAALSSGRGPWPVSALDARLAIAALGDHKWASTVRRGLFEDGAYLEELLTLAGGTVEESDVHFRLWKVDDTFDVTQRLRAQHVIARFLGRGHGFPSGAIRITAPMLDDRDRFSAALRASC